jgi:hypothetical protein
MKRAIICLTTLALCLSAVIAIAQQAAAPAKAAAPAAAPAPAKAAAPAAVAAPAAAPAAAAPAAPAAAAAGLTISTMEVAASVENRAPVGVATAFPAEQEKVFCYVELKDVAKDTSITFVWTFGQNEMGKVTQQIKKSSRWRTWSSKSLGGMKGDWKVDILDESGAVLKSAAFKIG